MAPKHRGQNSRLPNKKRFMNADADPTEPEERSVIVGINGKPLQLTAVKCDVHDLQSMDELKERLGMLLFGDRPAKLIYMDDGVELLALHLVKDNDILYATAELQPFYGENEPEQVPLKEPEEEAKPVEVAKRKAFNLAHPRRLLNPEFLVDQDTTQPPDGEPEKSDLQPRELKEASPASVASTEHGEQGTPAGMVGPEPKRDLIATYGGAEHFVYSEMLMSKPQTIPKILLPVNKDLKPAKTFDPSMGLKKMQKAGLTASTQKALEDLMRHVVADPKERVVEVPPIELTENIPEATPVGDVGVLPVAAPESKITKKQQQRLEFERNRLRQKRTRQKQKKKEKLADRERQETLLNRPAPGAAAPAPSDSDSGNSEDESGTDAAPPAKAARTVSPPRTAHVRIS